MIFPPGGESGEPEDARPGGPAPSELVRKTARTYARLRAFRVFVLVFGVALLLYLARLIWSKRPAAPPRTSISATKTAPPDTVQSLDRFEFSSALLGKKNFSISADRLRGIEGGMRFLEGIRSVEVFRPDGKSLKGRADRGSIAHGQDKTEGTSADRLVLEGNFFIEGPEGERIDTDRMEYSREEQTLTAPGASRFSLNGATGSAGSLLYDLEDKTIRAGDGIIVHFVSPGEPDLIARARTVVAAAGGESADLDGSVTLTHGEDSLTGPTLHIERERGEEGAIRFTLGPHAQGRLIPEMHPSEPSNTPGPALSAPLAGPAVPPATRSPGSLSGESLARPVTLIADRIEGVQEGRGGARTLTLRGGASAREDAAPGNLPGRAIAADTIELAEERRGSPRHVMAEGNVSASMPSPALGGGTTARPRTLGCRRLDLVILPNGTIGRGDVEGEVRLSFDGRSARAARATLTGETRTELRGDRPRVEEGARSLVADEIDILNQEGRLEARGAVRSRIVPDAKNESSLFAKGEPIDVSSSTATIERDTGRGSFKGDVVARQGVRALSAASLVLNDKARSAHAEGSVSLRSVREESRRVAVRSSQSPNGAVPEPGAGSKGVAGVEPTAASGLQGGAHERSDAASEDANTIKVPVRIDADALDHDDRNSATTFSGHAVYREPGRMLSATVITASGREAGGGFRDVTAEGQVQFEGEGKRGTADAARYRTSDRTLILEGRERPAEVVERATGRIWRGPSLTWVLTADSIPTVTGEQGRSKVTGALRPTGRESVGKKANRGTPR